MGGVMSEWLHLSTSWGPDGNPRRLYVEIADGEYRTIIKEGVEGVEAAYSAGMPYRYYPLEIEITVSEYKRFVRAVKEISAT